MEIWEDKEDGIGILLKYCFKWLTIGCGIILVLSITARVLYSMWWE